MAAISEQSTTKRGCLQLIKLQTLGGVTGWAI